MGLCTCEKCGKEYSYASGDCPKCGWPAPGNRVACRVCRKVISYKNHADYITYSGVVNGTTQTSTKRWHRACPHCGDPKPLLLVDDRANGLLKFLGIASWFVPPAVLLLDLRTSMSRWPVLRGVDPDVLVWAVIGAYALGSMLTLGVGWVRDLGRLLCGAAVLGALVSLRQQTTALLFAGAALSFALYRWDRRRARAAFDAEHLQPLRAPPATA